MRARTPATIGALLLVPALALCPTRARGEEPAKRAPSAASSPDDREALKREIAKFGLVALVEATLRDDKTRAPSAWAPPPKPAGATSAMWASSIRDASGPAGLLLSSSSDDDGPTGIVPPGQIATLGHRDPLPPEFRGHIHGTYAPFAPAARASALATMRIPPSTIHRLVHQTFGRFRVCYENALRVNPTLTGRVVVKFAIDPSGAVSLASDSGSDLPDPTVVACVVRNFAELTFPAFESGEVTVIYPLVFTPEAP